MASRETKAVAAADVVRAVEFLDWREQLELFGMLLGRAMRPLTPRQRFLALAELRRVVVRHMESG